LLTGFLSKAESFRPPEAPAPIARRRTSQPVERWKRLSSYMEASLRSAVSRTSKRLQRPADAAQVAVRHRPEPHTHDTDSSRLAQRVSCRFRRCPQVDDPLVGVLGQTATYTGPRFQVRGLRFASCHPPS